MATAHTYSNEIHAHVFHERRSYTLQLYDASKQMSWISIQNLYENHVESAMENMLYFRFVYTDAYIYIYFFLVLCIRANSMQNLRHCRALELSMRDLVLTLCFICTRSEQICDFNPTW